MAHQSHRETPFTKTLLQTAQRAEACGMDSLSLKVGFGRGERFVRKPYLFQIDVERCMRLSFVFSDTETQLPSKIKPTKIDVPPQVYN